MSGVPQSHVHVQNGSLEWINRTKVCNTMKIILH